MANTRICNDTVNAHRNEPMTRHNQLRTLNDGRDDDMDDMCESDEYLDDIDDTDLYPIHIVTRRSR